MKVKAFQTSIHGCGAHACEREREREGGKERERAGGREGGGRGTDLLECYRIRSKVQYSKESEFSPGKIS